MPDELIVQHCSPTLAGLKTGNLFAYQYESRRALTEEISRLNQSLSGKGLRVVPLRIGDNRALIYVYRPNKLRDDLARQDAEEILSQCGYCGNAGRCVVQLASRIRESESFPHEIGLFLGYPPEDVRGFMENRCCKCVGCWKVYGDAQSAQRTFDKYKKCTASYLRQLKAGNTLERLTVNA